MNELEEKKELMTKGQTGSTETLDDHTKKEFKKGKKAGRKLAHYLKKSAEKKRGVKEAIEVDEPKKKKGKNAEDDMGKEDKWKKTAKGEQEVEESAPVNGKAAVEVNGDILWQADAKDGGKVVVLKRKIKGAGQDKVLMRHLKNGKVTDYGSHVSVDKAKMFFKRNVGIIGEEFDLCEDTQIADIFDVDLGEAHELFSDQSTATWADQKAIAFGGRHGYTAVAVTSTKGMGPRSIVLFDLLPKDKLGVKDIKLKAGEKIYRYASDATIAGNMMPYVKANLARGLYYFLTQASSSGEIDEAEFETKAEKARFTRVISSQMMEETEIEEAHLKKGQKVTISNKYDEYDGLKGTIKKVGKNDTYVVTVHKAGQMRNKDHDVEYTGDELKEETEVTTMKFDKPLESSESLMDAIYSVVHEKKELPRQLKDKKNEMEVVKNDKVKVIDKKDWPEYKKQGWGLAEEVVVEEDDKEEESEDKPKMDKVDKEALKKKFSKRKDKDIDNDGDSDESDEYLHNRRKAISKEVEDDK